jgi:hypothetical protein
LPSDQPKRRQVEVAMSQGMIEREWSCHTVTARTKERTQGKVCMIFEFIGDSGWR